MQDDDYPVALVRATVNVDSLRAGMEAEVELTPRINSLLASGYLKLIGHVRMPTPSTPPAAAFAPTPIPPIAPIAAGDDPAPPPRTRPARKRAADNASGTGDS